MKFLFNKIFGLVWVCIQKYLGLGLGLGPDPNQNVWTWYKPWAAIKSALKPMKTIAQITLEIILNVSLIFSIWIKTLFRLHSNKNKLIC